MGLGPIDINLPEINRRFDRSAETLGNINLGSRDRYVAGPTSQLSFSELSGLRSSSRIDMDKRSGDVFRRISLVDLDRGILDRSAGDPILDLTTPAIDLTDPTIANSRSANVLGRTNIITPVAPRGRNLKDFVPKRKLGDRVVVRGNGFQQLLSSQQREKKRNAARTGFDVVESLSKFGPRSLVGLDFGGEAKKFEKNLGLAKDLPTIKSSKPEGISDILSIATKPTSSLTQQEFVVPEGGNIGRLSGLNAGDEFVSNRFTVGKIVSERAIIKAEKSADQELINKFGDDFDPESKEVIDFYSNSIDKHFVNEVKSIAVKDFQVKRVWGSGGIFDRSVNVLTDEAIMFALSAKAFSGAISLGGKGLKGLSRGKLISNLLKTKVGKIVTKVGKPVSNIIGKAAPPVLVGAAGYFGFKEFKNIKEEFGTPEAIAGAIGMGIGFGSEIRLGTNYVKNQFSRLNSKLSVPKSARFTGQSIINTPKPGEDLLAINKIKLTTKDVLGRSKTETIFSKTKLRDVDMNKNFITSKALTETIGTPSFEGSAAIIRTAPKEGITLRLDNSGKITKTIPKSLRSKLGEFDDPSIVRRILKQGDESFLLDVSGGKIESSSVSSRIRKKLNIQPDKQFRELVFEKGFQSQSRSVGIKDVKIREKPLNKQTEFEKGISLNEKPSLPSDLLKTSVTDEVATAVKVGEKPVFFEEIKPQKVGGPKLKMQELLEGQTRQREILIDRGRPAEVKTSKEFIAFSESDSLLLQSGRTIPFEGNTQLSFLPQRTPRLTDEFSFKFKSGKRGGGNKITGDATNNIPKDLFGSKGTSNKQGSSTPKTDRPTQILENQRLDLTPQQEGAIASQVGTQAQAVVKQELSKMAQNVLPPVDTRPVVKATKDISKSIVAVQSVKTVVGSNAVVPTPTSSVSQFIVPQTINNPVVSQFSSVGLINSPKLITRGKASSFGMPTPTKSLLSFERPIGGSKIPTGQISKGKLGIALGIIERPTQVQKSKIGQLSLEKIALPKPRPSPQRTVLRVINTERPVGRLSPFTPPPPSKAPPKTPRAKIPLFGLPPFVSLGGGGSGSGRRRRKKKGIKGRYKPSLVGVEMGIIRTGPLPTLTTGLGIRGLSKQQFARFNVGRKNPLL